MTGLRTAGWYTYPWALSGATDLAAMQASGMSHVAIAASYHAGKFLQPRGAERVYFPEDGTVYFRCDASRYGRLKPLQASLLDERDVLRAACEAESTAVRAWTVLNHNSRLGWEHPEVVARNAWGDPYYYSLCPAHGDVQDYAVALCADLAASYPLESLLLETPGWLTYDHGYHHEFAQIEISPELSQLLGLCFCNACETGARAAGIDFAGLRNAVAARCDALIAGVEPDGALDEHLAPFHAWRASVVTALCARIRQTVRTEVGVRVISTCQRPHRTTYLEGGDLAALDGVTDGLELPIYQPSAELAEADLRYVLGQVPDAARLSVILRPGHPDMQSEAQLRDTLARVLAAGIGDVSFYNFALLPAASIDWTLRAVADARSSTT
jgi:hypothetical protein